jgi:dipeptidyl aminopeptidase/acylaminoacyl peptidase
MGDSSERHSRRRWVIGGLIGLAVIALFLYGAASFVVYDQVGRAPQACWPNDQENTPTSFKVDSKWDQSLATAWPLPAPQDVTFTSRDPQIPDAQLAAWWIPAEGVAAADAPAVVIVHGIQSCRREASVLLAAGMLHQAGYSVFLMDLRDHGDSQGDDARFAGGSEEYMDVLGGWDWVRGQGVPADRIGLMGFSFGSISALIAGGEEPAVPAMWADSAAKSMYDAIGNFLVDQIHDPTGISRILVPGALLWARVIAGDDLLQFDPVAEVGKYGGRSLAFVHGADDAVLPASWAVDMQDAAEQAGAKVEPAWIVPGAGHTQEIYVDSEGYRERLVAFFDKALGQP